MEKDRTLTAFSISRATRERLDLYGVVVGWAIQAAWLRWDVDKWAPTARKHDSPWEVAIYEDVPFPTLNAEELAHGFGATPDEAVECALADPNVRFRSGVARALWLLGKEVRELAWVCRVARAALEPPPTLGEYDDDDIPF